MVNSGRGQPAVENAPHPLPPSTMVLTAPRQHTPPQPLNLRAEQHQCRVIRAHPAHCARLAGPVSVTRFAGAVSPRPVPFPPSPPPPPRGRLCSETSPVLWNCPTSYARSSPACVPRLPGAACDSISPGEHRSSRFSSKAFPYMLGASDRARPVRISRYRCARGCLPPRPTASAPRRSTLSRLNTQPARTPVNASALPLRSTPHVSGPVWVATLSPVWLSHPLHRAGLSRRTRRLCH